MTLKCHFNALLKDLVSSESRMTFDVLYQLTSLLVYRSIVNLVRIVFETAVVDFLQRSYFLSFTSLHLLSFVFISYTTAHMFL